ncbi:zinc-binding dehydrogenase [Actinomadura rudentiformis]|uniref:Zinc-binding dehydrogenase n=1 Tax=Actinomadura rudentiformis TaxID=359158 RepID=A0A6H9Z904_9ACTN|nr:zinc-binding dehydrogenase [Actinomadura rudentiformis]
MCGNGLRTTFGILVPGLIDTTLRAERMVPKPSTGAVPSHRQSQSVLARIATVRAVTGLCRLGAGSGVGLLRLAEPADLPEGAAACVADRADPEDPRRLPRHLRGPARARRADPGQWLDGVARHGGDADATPSQIIAIDLADSRLEAAKQFGASVTVNNGRQDPLAVVRELTGGLGADTTIEAVGVPDTFELAVALARRRS